MNQIDFAVAFLLLISVLTYSFLYVTSNLSKDFGFYETKRLEQSAEALLKQLFYIKNEKSLITNFKKAQVLFTEVGGYSHSETLNITIKPAVEKVHVYDNFFNEIQSTKIESEDNVTISFELDFLPKEKKYVNIFYEGKADEITYSIAEENDIVSIILFEENVYVLSQERCLELKSLSYENAKNRFGFLDDFNINGCDYGQAIPTTTNVIVKSIPILIEKDNEKIYPSIVRLKVW